MSKESEALGKAAGNLGRIVQKGKELAQEERRPPIPVVLPSKGPPTPTEQPPRS
jgi:hypothetical protein